MSRPFVLLPVDDGRRTRFLFRSRWRTAPWWLTLGGWLAVLPADFVMSRDMLHGVKQRAEKLTRTHGRDGQPASRPRVRPRPIHGRSG